MYRMFREVLSGLLYVAVSGWLSVGHSGLLYVGRTHQHNGLKKIDFSKSGVISDLRAYLAFEA